MVIGMAKLVELSDKTYSNLMSLMGPDDTTDSLVKRLIGNSAGGPATSGAGRPNRRQDRRPEPIALQYNGNEHPDLTHSRIRAVFLNEHFEAKIKTWKELRSEVLIRALRFKPEIGQRLSGVLQGTKHNQGYAFHSDVGFSIQAQDANDSWRSVVTVAREMGWAVRVDFEWMDKAAAANPGASAELIVHPSTGAQG